MGAKPAQSEELMCTSAQLTGSLGLDDVLPWHVLHVRPNCERKTSTFLTYRGFEIFLPTERRLAARKKEVAVPLFPGYVFCRFDPGNLVPILSAPGIVQILSRDHRPEPVPTAEIFALQSLARANRSMQAGPLYAAGEPVRIVAGPLAGVEGAILRDAGRARLIVSVSILNRSVVAEIDRDLIGTTSFRPSIAALPSQSKPSVFQLASTVKGAEFRNSLGC